MLTRRGFFSTLSAAAGIAAVTPQRLAAEPSRTIYYEREDLALALQRGDIHGGYYFVSADMTINDRTIEHADIDMRGHQLLFGDRWRLISNVFWGAESSR